jgi:hypothetical protein
LKVTITQHDIDHGLAASFWHCPVALAVTRKTGLGWKIDNDRATYDEEHRVLSLRARQFIRNFDSGKRVKPCSMLVWKERK